jgi:sensor histidine kinase YesM
MTATTTDIRLNDQLIRWIGIPFFGMVIPNVSGLFGDLAFTDVRYWLGYPYFILLSGAIWQGNRYLLFRTRKRFTWFDKPIEKLILLCFNNIFYTTPLTIAWLCLWYRWAGFSQVHWDVILVVALINVIAVLFITHVYETVFMVKEQLHELTRNAQLQQAKAEAELQALKNQIDPHFMFNSLNSLSYLITSDRDKALEFTENLAEIYRYILSQKDFPLVPLADELAFSEKYLRLLRLRFGDALDIRKNFSEANASFCYIPPISIFVALENIVKHNEISAREPLMVELQLNSETIEIRNTIRPKINIGHSSKIGIRNLDERFRILMGRHIIVEAKDNSFTVTLPLVVLQTS